MHSKDTNQNPDTALKTPESLKGGSTDFYVACLDKLVILLAAQVFSLPLVWLYEGGAFQIELLLHAAKFLCTVQGLRTLQRSYFGFAAFFTLL